MHPDLEEFKQAGKISQEALLYGKSLIVKGVSLLEVTEKIEEFVKKKGAGMAFPAQISCNEIAAHYCAFKDDSTVLTDQVICLDVGVEVNGCIGDNALTIDLSGQHADLVKASKDALQAATEILELGVKVSALGKAIEDTIVSEGFQPVRNLSGHGLGRYQVHAGIQIPNYDTKDDTVLEEGFYAIEPFATTGTGFIQEEGEANVFAMLGKKSVRVGFVRDIQREIEKYQGLPFTKRWLQKKYSDAQLRYAFANFEQLETLKSYPPLVERSKGLVSQAEHSFYVGKEVIQLTK